MSTGKKDNWNWVEWSSVFEEFENSKLLYEEEIRESKVIEDRSSVIYHPLSVPAY